MPPHFFNPYIFGANILFTLLSLIFCIIIYLKTRESYELTKHPGIGYFRDAFLFFGISYVLRFLLNIIMLSTMALDIFMPRHMLMPVSMLVLSYFSTMGIIYLILSTIWKKLSGTHMIWFGHGLAALLSVIAFLTRSPMILLYMQCLLLFIAALLTLVKAHDSKKITQTKVLYSLVILLWLMNLLIINRRGPFSFTIEIVFEVISLIVFVIIYHKISKWLH
jgi:hypothetical protein